MTLKSTKLKHLADEMATCIYSCDLSLSEMREYIADILIENFCHSVADFPKGYKCDHGVRLDTECERCNRASEL